jgi:cytochrome P450
MLLSFVFALAVAYLLVDFIASNRGRHVHWRLPLFRDLLHVLYHFDVFHDWAAQKFVSTKMDVIVLKFANYDVVGIVNPVDVRHVLKDNWKNYVVSEGLRGNALKDIFGKGIFNADNNQWYLQRKHSSREFNANVFRNTMTQEFIEHTSKLRDILDSCGREPVDMHAMFFRLTLDAFGKVAFGINVGGLDGNPIPFARAFDRAQEITARRVVKPPILWKLQKLLQVGDEKELSECLSTINTFVTGLVKDRSSPGAMLSGFDDLLTKLMRACDSDAEVGADERDQYLRDMTVNFIIAGRDTTACALSWLLFELCAHPAVEKRLLEELDGVLQGRLPSFDDLNECHFLTACLSEALRLHPSVPLDIKTAVADDVLPTGTKVFAGHTVGYLPYSMARLESIWGADAAEFNPSRWLDSNGGFVRADAFKYPVFQAGPRQCLGVDMAMLEMKVVVGMLLPRLQFTIIEEPTYRVGLVLQMKNGLITQVTKRTVGCS